MTLDIVGTGGDQFGTINISTGSCIVAAAAGVPIAKHGNRSVSGHCGAADVLEGLGIKINMEPEEVAACIEAVGIGFMYGPLFHPAIKKLVEIRRELRVMTSVNLLGALTNPARAKYRMIGVSTPTILDTIARTIQTFDIEHALVFHGSGIDEISTLGPVDMREITPKGIKTKLFDPQKFGFRKCLMKELQGIDKNENVSLIMEVLEGKQGAIHDTFVLNAAVAVWLYKLADSIEEGIEIAKETLSSGKALDKLNEWKAICQTFSMK
jgi:anthranilate phosphoribosyltransferase